MSGPNVFFLLHALALGVLSVAAAVRPGVSRDTGTDLIWPGEIDLSVHGQSMVPGHSFADLSAPRGTKVPTAQELDDAASAYEAGDSGPSDALVNSSRYPQETVLQIMRRLT